VSNARYEAELALRLVVAGIARERARARTVRTALRSIKATDPRAYRQIGEGWRTLSPAARAALPLAPAQFAVFEERFGAVCVH